jgi:hypothetical protein
MFLRCRQNIRLFPLRDGVGVEAKREALLMYPRSLALKASLAAFQEPEVLNCTKQEDIAERQAAAVGVLLGFLRLGVFAFGIVVMCCST